MRNHTQFCADLGEQVINLRQIPHEIVEKSSKIVPLGAPFFPIKTRVFENPRWRGRRPFYPGFTIRRWPECVWMDRFADTSTKCRQILDQF